MKPILTRWLLLFLLSFGAARPACSQAGAPAAAPGPPPTTATAPTAATEAAPRLVVPPGAQAGPNFNVETATQAWLDTLTPAQKAKSDAYFEGGYWLLLWDFLSTGCLPEYNQQYFYTHPAEYVHLRTPTV